MKGKVKVAVRILIFLLFALLIFGICTMGRVRVDDPTAPSSVLDY